MAEQVSPEDLQVGDVIEVSRLSMTTLQMEPRPSRVAFIMQMLTDPSRYCFKIEGDGGSPRYLKATETVSRLERAKERI